MIADLIKEQEAQPDIFEWVFLQKWSNAAKLVFFFLAQKHLHGKTTLCVFQSSASLALRKGLFQSALKELIADKIVSIHNVRGLDTLRFDCLIPNYNAPQSRKNASSCDLKPLDSVLTLLARFKSLHATFLGHEKDSNPRDMLFMRSVCKKFGAKRVEVDLENFFRHKRYLPCLEKKKTRQVALTDFYAYLDQKQS